MTDEYPDANLVAEFTGYRETAQARFAAPPTAGVFATARTRAVRRRTVTALTAVVAVAALLAGVAVFRPTASKTQPVGPPPSPAPSTSSGVPDAPDPSQAQGSSATSAPPAATDKGNQVRFIDQATAGRIRGMTVTLPRWPGGNECPGGRFTFRNGEAAINGTGQMYAVPDRGLGGIFANLDGRPGDEVVVPLGCGSVELDFGLLALRRTGAGFEVMGYVLQAVFDRYFPDGPDLVVEVGTTPSDEGVEQRRRYRWQGSRFVQVGGPTTPPTGPFTPPADPRNGSLWVPYTLAGNPPCNSGGTLSFVEGTSGTWGYQEQGVSIDQAEYFMGGISRGTLARPAGAPAAGGPDLLVTLTCRRPDGFSQQFVLHANSGSVLMATGRAADPGVTGIVTHRVADGQAEVTVRTTRGEEVRRYRFDGYRFTRAA